MASDAEICSRRGAVVGLRDVLRTDDFNVRRWDRSGNGSAPRRRETPVEEDSTWIIVDSPEADERLSRVTGGLEPRDKGHLG